MDCGCGPEGRDSRVHFTSCCSASASVQGPRTGEPSRRPLRCAMAGRRPWRSRRIFATTACRISRSRTCRSSSSRRRSSRERPCTRHVALSSPAMRVPATTRLSTVPDDEALLRELRSALTAQATPVVEALYEWSGFARKGTWGMLTSSWARAVHRAVREPERPASHAAGHRGAFRWQTTRSPGCGPGCTPVSLR